MKLLKEFVYYVRGYLLVFKLLGVDFNGKDEGYWKIILVIFF